MSANEGKLSQRYLNLGGETHPGQPARRQRSRPADLLSHPETFRLLGR